MELFEELTLLCSEIPTLHCGGGSESESPSCGQQLKFLFCYFRAYIFLFLNEHYVK